MRIIRFIRVNAIVFALYKKIGAGLFGFNALLLIAKNFFVKAFKYGISYYCLSYPSMLFRTLAGFPPTITFGGTSLVTTLPAAIMELSLMLTPGQIVTPIPIYARLPIVIGLQKVAWRL